MTKHRRNEYNDAPIADIAQRADMVIALGATTFQKFSCAHCGSRQTVDEPNTFFRQGECEECGHITDITICGFSMRYPMGANPENDQALLKLMGKQFRCRAMSSIRPSLREIELDALRRVLADARLDLAYAEADPERNAQFGNLCRHDVSQLAQRIRAILTALGADPAVWRSGI
jgi:hypothetical protein